MQRELTDSNQKRLLTPREKCAELACGLTTLRRLVRDGVVRQIRIGYRTRRYLPGSRASVRTGRPCS